MDSFTGAGHDVIGRTVREMQISFPVWRTPNRRELVDRPAAVLLSGCTSDLPRQYFPKKTDFRDILRHARTHVTDRINNRPRTRLNYLTPLEALNKAGIALQM